MWVVCVTWVLFSTFFIVIRVIVILLDIVIVFAIGHGWDATFIIIVDNIIVVGWFFVNL